MIRVHLCRSRLQYYRISETEDVTLFGSLAPPVGERGSVCGVDKHAIEQRDFLSYTEMKLHWEANPQACDTDNRRASQRHWLHHPYSKTNSPLNITPSTALLKTHHHDVNLNECLDLIVQSIARTGFALVTNDLPSDWLKKNTPAVQPQFYLMDIIVVDATGRILFWCITKARHRDQWRYVIEAGRLLTKRLMQHQTKQGTYHGFIDSYPIQCHLYDLDTNTVTKSTTKPV